MMDLSALMTLEIAVPLPSGGKHNPARMGMLLFRRHQESVHRRGTIVLRFMKESAVMGAILKDFILKDCL